MVKFDEFKRLDLRIAKVVGVEEHPNADKLYIVTIDTGGEKKKVVAGIKEHYKPDEVMGKSVAVITNLEPATIRGVESHGMILAAKDSKGLSVLTPDKDIETGSRIT